MSYHYVKFGDGYAHVHVSDIVRIPLDCAGRELTADEIDMGVGDLILNRSHVFMLVSSAYTGFDVYLDRDCTKELVGWWNYRNVADSTTFFFSKYF